MAESDSVDERRPFIADLRVLHWYARSHMPEEKYSQHALTEAMAALGVDLSVDATAAAITRLEREYDVVLIERRPTLGERGKEVAPDPAIPEHLDHPEDWEAFPSPRFSSRRKSRLTLDGAIFAEVASLLAGYELIAREATGRTAPKKQGIGARPRAFNLKALVDWIRAGEGTARTAPKKEGEKARPDAFDRKAVLGWLRLERRRLQMLVEQVRSPDASVFHLRADDPDAGLVGEPIDRRIMELPPPRTGAYPEEEPQLP